MCIRLFYTHAAFQTLKVDFNIKDRQGDRYLPLNKTVKMIIVIKCKQENKLNFKDILK